MMEVCRILEQVSAGLRGKLRGQLNGEGGVGRFLNALNRGWFDINLDVSAIKILNNRWISECKGTLERSKDLFPVGKFRNLDALHTFCDLNGLAVKCLLLRPDIRYDAPHTWSDALHTLLDRQYVQLIPFSLTLKYTNWTYIEVLSALFDQAEYPELPTSFSLVGHIAHVNLREQFLPYRYLIGRILRDKNPAVRTVINKLDIVGADLDNGEEDTKYNAGDDNKNAKSYSPASNGMPPVTKHQLNHHREFRTFRYEVIADHLDNLDQSELIVTVSEQNCHFTFDYAKVYWNSRLSTEHERIVSMFQPGQIICDVMAGVGPFSLPAAKKKIKVWANDLNPHSYAWLNHGIQRNKLTKYIQSYNQDGRDFIPFAVTTLIESSNILAQQSFSHFILNLPASALTFLPCFIGIYNVASHSNLSSRYHEDLGKLPLPWIHVYTFAEKRDPNVYTKLRDEVNRLIDYPLTLRYNRSYSSPGNLPQEGQLDIFNVRDVAPKKSMFCITFRLPRIVAIR